jgi:hypothetical protein
MTDHLYPLGSSASSPSYSWTTLDLLMPPPGAPYVTPPSPCARRGGWPASGAVAGAVLVVICLPLLLELAFYLAYQQLTPRTGSLSVCRV